MEKGVNIYVDDFMSLFVAVSFLQEQIIFNIENVKSYLNATLELDPEAINYVDASVEKMINAGMIMRVPGFNNVIKINKSIPFKEIVYDKCDYLEEMIEFFYEYNNYCFGKENDLLLNHNANLLKK